MNRLSQRTQYGGSPEGGQGGGYAGYWKIALYKRFSFNLFFSFFFHNIVVLSSTYDVDFMIWFLKRWYFFQEKQKKNQAIMNVFFFFCRWKI